MKHLTSVLAILSLFAAAPALASDVSSDRYFAETKAAQSRKATTDGGVAPSPEVKKGSCARCSCAKSDDPRAPRTDTGAR